MLFKRLAQSRILLVRPLRPPNLPRKAPSPRLFTQNTQLLLIAHRTSRPQLPYLNQPVFRFQPTLLGPNPQLARLLSTETRQYIREQVYLAAKWTAIAWTFVALFGIAYVGYAIEIDERKDPTPNEWRFWTRLALRGARVTQREGARVGFVNWAVVGSEYKACLENLENTSKDGKGVCSIEGGETLIPEVGRVGFDISAKSWPWRACYYEVIMGSATVAEHLDGMVLDRTRRIIFPKEFVIGPSNPDPRPLPAHSKVAPLEENCERPYAPPETFYMRILTSKGFTTTQKLNAALGYASWLEYKGLNESAKEMYKWGLDIAKAGLPTTMDPAVVIDNRTSVLKDDAAHEVTPNILHAATSLAIHSARVGDVSAALPILLSVLRARRNSPVSTVPQSLRKSGILGQDQQPEATTDIGAAINIVKRIIRPYRFPAPPPTGDLPFERASEKPTCEESELMLYIGEILYATSPHSAEGLGWTRQGVTIAEANLQSGKNNATLDMEERAKCKQCLAFGASNWEIMLNNLSVQQASSSVREGGRSAGLLEWRGWFGRDGGVKGKTLDELNAGVVAEELKHVAKLKENIARSALEEDMARAGGGQPGSVWIG